MTPHHNLLLAAAVAIFSALPQIARAEVTLTGKPTISFTAEGHPGALDIEGKSTGLQLEDTGDAIILTVPARTVSTGIDLRDQHMQEKYIQVEQHPDLVLSVPRSAFDFPTEKGKATEGQAAATFSAHGQDQPVTVVWNLRRSKTGWQVRGDFDFDTRALGIEVPSYLGITVEPTMHARARFDITEGGD